MTINRFIRSPHICIHQISLQFETGTGHNLWGKKYPSLDYRQGARQKKGGGGYGIFSKKKWGFFEI